MNKDILKDAIEKGIKQIMQESDVPYAVHKESIKKMKELIDGLKEEIKNLQQEVKDNEKSRKQHEGQIEFYNKQIQSYQREVERIRTIMKGDRGEKGERGDDGLSPSVEEIVRQVLSVIPLPKDGKDGEKGKDGKDATVNQEKIIKEIIDQIRKKKLISMGDINGGFSKDGINYKFEELMHGGGGSSGGSITYSYDLSSQCDGANKVFTVPSNTNFIQLTGSDSPQVYRPTVDYTGSGTTTLTLDAGVPAPSSGATLILLYVV